MSHLSLLYVRKRRLEFVHLPVWGVRCGESRKRLPEAGGRRADSDRLIYHGTALPSPRLAAHSTAVCCYFHHPTSLSATKSWRVVCWCLYHCNRLNVSDWFTSCFETDTLLNSPLAVKGIWHETSALSKMRCVHLPALLEQIIIQCTLKTTRPMLYLYQLLIYIYTADSWPEFVNTTFRVQKLAW